MGRAISNRANCLKRQGKLREAEADYTRALEIDDSNPKAFINRGALFRDQGLSVRAHRDFERALALDPHNAMLQQDLRLLADKLKELGVASGGDGGDGGGKGGAAADRARQGTVAQGGVPLQRERL